MRFAKLPFVFCLAFSHVAFAQTAPEAPPSPRPAPAPLKIETPTSSLKLGLLLQPQYEMAGHPVMRSVSHNLYVRRIRLLASATLFKNVEVFFDTDYPNLFKGDQTTGTKSTPGLNVQDAFGTYKALEDALKVDMGYMLPPSTHNADQGAGTLYGWDYFANSFNNGQSFNSSGNPVGRDAGVQLRGLVLENHLEYRAGLFQGRRNTVAADGRVGDRNFFRFAARLQVNVLDPETGFFYAGSYLGTKRVLSFGAAVDLQDSYVHWGADAFADMPLGDGVLTAQVNLAHYNGKDFIMTAGVSTPLANQTALMGEAGYLFDAINVSPILRFEKLWNDSANVNLTQFGGGLAFWPYGHSFNLKAFYTRVVPTAAMTHGFNQINVQAQVYVF